jgi:alkylation response protein AidB-like acyl-CoA dehydrogenase
MRATIGELESALVELASAVASDTGVSTIEQLPPNVDAEKAWAALASSGLLNLRADGGTVLDLVLCAEQFAETLSATPFVGACLARELVGSSDDRIVGSLSGAIALDGLGADQVAFVRAGRAHVADAGATVTSADRSRVSVHTSTSDVTSIAVVDEAKFLAIAQLLLSADLVGNGLAAISEAVAYAKERQQFGVAVGAFQAIQHLLADAFVDVIAARNAVRSAAWRVEYETPEAHSAAARAALVASEAGIAACEVAAQVLGGIGHTWEHLMSVRLRRALSNRSQLPTPRAELLLAPIAATPAGIAENDGFDLRDDAIEASVRLRLRTWLATKPSVREWHAQLAASGFVGVSMPTDAGGAGLPVTCDAIVSEELGNGGFPPPPAIAHLAHALAEFGNSTQRKVHLARMLDGSVRWCQGFSEPGAGSDLAAIRTRAVPDGNDFVINGRKIWTSEATQAEWILLLCRTGEHPHHGLSVLLLPLDTPGIEVSTIVTAWGSDEFAEVSFVDVRVPSSALLGTEGQGWLIAMSLLAVERGPADIGWISRFRGTARALLQNPDTAMRPDVQRAAAWIEALDATVAVTLTERRNETFEVAKGSIDKLLMTKVDQLLHSAALQANAKALIETTSEDLERYLWARAASVFGGTSQIQRNIVAQRVLGLPRR